MSNKHFSSRKGQYIYCDICGQATYIWEMTRLATETGRGGLLVCPNDADKIDHGLIPYRIPPEKRVQFARVNHQNLTNGTDVLDIETSNALGV